MFLAGCVLYGIILNTADKTLKEEMDEKKITQIENAILVIDRNDYKLYLYDDTTLVKEYKAVFGRNPDQKKIASDLATPIGTYEICEIDSTSKYNIFLRINYPNIDDISEGLKLGLLTKKEYEDLRFDYFYGTCINENTRMGGKMGIHGIGDFDLIFRNLPFVFNWTNGSIAVSNSSIEEIASVIRKGTKVVIKK